MTHKLTCIFLALTVLLAGCSGGTATDGPEADTTPTSVTTPDNTPSGAAALSVPGGFDFATSELAHVRVSLGWDVPHRTYLTVCLPIADGSGPDYSSCLKRTPVFGGSYMSDIEISNDVETLVATLWSFEPAEVLRSVEWNRSGDPDAIEILID